MRRFECSHCGTEIQIPANLPPTTGLCPKCGQEITSPGPEVSPVPIAEQVVAEVQTSPIVDEIPLEESPMPTSNVPETAVESASINVGGNEVSSEEPVPVLEPITEVTEPPQSSSGSPLKILGIVAAIIVLLCVLLGAAKIFLSPPNKDDSEVQRKPVKQSLTPQERAENAYRAKGWIPEAEAVLAQMMSSKSVAERAALTIQGSQNTDSIALFEKRFPEETNRTPASAFSPILGGKADSDRGLFVLVYSRPREFSINSFFRPVAPLRVNYNLEKPNSFLILNSSSDNFVDDALIVTAYFKKTPEGLKLDWPTFSQSKYRLFEEFISTPQAGKSGIFRVSIQEDVDLESPATGRFSLFRLSDPVNRKSFTKILVPDDSIEGLAFAPLKWRHKLVSGPPTSNATVVLEWTNESEPTLQMREFVCWEFLGLGGERGNWKKKIGE